VAVIVDYGDVIDRAFGVETPANSAEIVKALADELRRYI